MNDIIPAKNYSLHKHRFCAIRTYIYSLAAEYKHMTILFSKENYTNE